MTCRSLSRCAQASSTGAARLCTVPCSSARSPPTYPPISAARAGPQAGRMRLAWGAVDGEFSLTTSTLSCPTTILNVANLSRASKGPWPPLNPPSLAPPQGMTHSPRHHSHLSFVRPLPCSDRRDFSGGRASFWLALAVAVPPAAPLPPPRWLCVLVLERHRLPSGPLPTVPRPHVGGLREW